VISHEESFAAVAADRSIVGTMNWEISINLITVKAGK
jgi:hypothetical protein